MLKNTSWLLAILLAACGSGKQADAPMRAEDTVFGSDVQALDKARQVQDTLMQDKANTDAAIDAAAAASSAP